jgi:hypothetical protein
MAGAVERAVRGITSFWEKMSTPPGIEFAVPHYQLLRVLSDRERSKVFLARAEQGGLVALKLELPNAPEKMEAIVRRYGTLRELTTAEGFARILEFGRLDSGWVWHAMPLADNLPGLAPVTSEPGLLHYTPLSLASWTLENGPAQAEQVAQWGQRLCRALGELHRAGLVHRDVKPANLLFIEGGLCLADYGLVGAPGSEYDFCGTEGFIPLEGTSDPAADLFALGKTLYQAWSGKDRLEFPSLPVETTEGLDWKHYGERLNDVILRACHAQPSRRFRSAEELLRALSEVLAGKARVSRRGWLVAVGALAVVSSAAWLAHRSRWVAVAVWRRVGSRGFSVEAWNSIYFPVDWTRGCLYSVCRDMSGFWFHTFDLRTFELRTRKLDVLPPQDVCSFLHPVRNQLWAVEGGLGEVYEIDVENGKVRGLGGGPDPRRNACPALYWNPITRRMGSFGGYGFMSVNNARHEFDETAGKWIAMSNEPAGRLPWPRHCAYFLFDKATPTRLFLVGGGGSPTGVQGQKIQGLQGFDGRFHQLDDIWELNLRDNRWTEVLPPGRFPASPLPLQQRAVFYHPRLRAIIYILGRYFQGEQGGGTASVWLVRPGVDNRPLPVAQKGEMSRLTAVRAFTFDPVKEELLILAEDGIFSVSFE